MATGSIDALFAAVYADPDADEPRQALAAALAERTDPRGEFISLQLQETRTRANQRQERRLLKEHAKAWLSPLRGALVAKTIKWERGFPVSDRLAFQKKKKA